MLTTLKKLVIPLGALVALTGLSTQASALPIYEAYTLTSTTGGAGGKLYFQYSDDLADGTYSVPLNEVSPGKTGWIVVELKDTQMTPNFPTPNRFDTDSPVDAGGINPNEGYRYTVQNQQLIDLRLFSFYLFDEFFGQYYATLSITGKKYDYLAWAFSSNGEVLGSIRESGVINFPLAVIPSAVPEPSDFMLLLSGLGIVWAGQKARSRQKAGLPTAV